MEAPRYLGLELSGAKNERSAMAILDHYPKNQKLILVDLDQRFMGIGDKSSDEVLVSACNDVIQGALYQGLGIHGPISLPPFFNKETSSENTEFAWMQRAWDKLRPRPRPFLPYQQRPCEIYLKHICPEKFLVPDALGSNWAPIAARLQYLLPHLKQPIYEVFPRATLSRIISNLGLSKHILRGYTDLERGLYFRERFFEDLTKKLPQIFIYEKDLELMILELNCFHAFLAALTIHLKKQDQCEKPPTSFPEKSSWIELPRKNIDWSKVF